MSQGRWMKDKNSQIRIGPEFQAVIPDLIQEKPEKVLKVEENNVNAESKITQAQQKQNVYLLGESELKYVSNNHESKGKAKPKTKQSEAKNNGAGGGGRDSNKNLKQKVIKVKK
ncbi:hypothetical protein FG386_002151 [Cryptosporidium ryanae]|uniref:uncharacterized protein n=1 Tax=Cryptosporidium ryanae TaxID=515981 RepID=UPI00351A926A|nr:hypothetical protein FG386_002151 [Cryptosporidium ryanae]